MILTLDYTNLGRRPGSAKIVADWKKNGRPDNFVVEYGETFAEFQLCPSRSNIFGVSSSYWDASGNGCEGVKRHAVTELLNKHTREEKRK